MYNVVSEYFEQNRISHHPNRYEMNSCTTTLALDAPSVAGVTGTGPSKCSIDEKSWKFAIQEFPTSFTVEVR